MLEINFSVVVQVVNFLVLLFLLNKFLYQPIRTILSRRAEEMDTLANRVEEYLGKSEEREKGIEEGTILARKEGYSRREACKAEAASEERGILKEAASSVEQQVGAAREDIEAKIAGVRKALDDQVSALSSELAEKILGRSVR